MDIRRIQSSLINNVKKTNFKNSEKTEKKNEVLTQKRTITGSSRKYIELAKTLPDERSVKISKIKESIENDSYKVDTKNIVKKMIGGK